MTLGKRLEPGTVFGERYRVVARLRAGSMGAVYEVVDERTGSPRALKVMLPSALADSDKRARFALEARITGPIDSDHIVRVFDAGIERASGAPFLVMELLRGRDLGALVDERGSLPGAEVLTYLDQAARALERTHAAGIIHRDLKPANFFLTAREDGSPCVKILDFGIAKVLGGSAGDATRSLGTPLYMAPEQIRGEAVRITPRTDVYALGQVAYRLLVGEPYWAADAEADASLHQMVMSILDGASEAATERATRRSGASLPEAFDPWFARCTAPREADRFESASAAIRELRSALTAPAISPPGRRTRVVVIALLVVLAGALVCAIIWWPRAPTARSGAASSPSPTPPIVGPQPTATEAPSPPSNRRATSRAPLEAIDLAEFQSRIASRYSTSSASESVGATFVYYMVPVFRGEVASGSVTYTRYQTEAMAQIVERQSQPTDGSSTSIFREGRVVVAIAFNIPEADRRALFEAIR